MAKIDIDEIGVMSREDVTEHLTNNRFRFYTNNFYASTPDERKDTSFPLNGINLTDDEVKEQTRQYLSKEVLINVNILRLCTLSKDNGIQTYSTLGSFQNVWDTLTAYLLLMRYLSLLNEFWQNNSFALLPEEEMESIRNDVETIEHFLRLLHPEAKNLIAIKAIREITDKEVVESKEMASLRDDDDYNSPWDINAFSEAVNYNRDGNGSYDRKVALGETSKETYISPVNSKVLNLDSGLDAFKNRVKRW